MRYFRAFLAACVFFAACNPVEEPVGPPVETDDGIIVASGGETSFSIVYGSAKINAEGFAAFLSDRCGVDVPVVRDNGDVSDYEILVGECDRPACAEVAKDLAGTFGYSARVVGTRLVIMGSDVTWTSFGLRAVVKKLREECLDGQELIVPKNFEVKQTTDDPQMIARLIRQKYDFTLSPVQVLTCGPDEDIYVAQGAAGDDQYIYISMRNAGDTKARVYKYSINSKNLIGKSDIFNAGHCNDMTFDFSRQQVIVAHGHNEGRILTPLDAETLEVKHNLTIPVGSGAITYNAYQGGYAISQGGSTFYVTDSNFKVTLSGKRTDSTGYTAQGMGSDDSYVYFPMSGSKDNILVVYDWDGKFVTTLTVPLTIESESMFYAAGRYYVAFYAGSKVGAQLYEIIPVHYYSYSK